MATNPFDQFDAAPNANPFDQFDAPPKPATSSSSSGAAPDLGTTALWNKPANVSWSDYMLAHLAKPFQGADQAAQDYSRTAVDAATFGYGDRLQSYLTGNTLADERANTAAASGRLGAMAPIVQGAMYGIGPGELGLGAKLAGKLGAEAGGVGGWLAGVGGSAAEGAGVGALGAAGHDENIGQGALVGGLTGGAGGAIGGIAGKGRGEALPPAVDEATLAADKTAAYKTLGDVRYNNADVRQAAANAINEINQQPARIARNGQGALDALNEIGNTHAIGPGAQSGEDINDFIRSFKKVNTGDSVDEAGQIAQKHFNSLLDNTQPTVAGNQVPGQVGAGRTALTDANAAYGRLKDTGLLNDWERKAATGGSDVGTQAQGFLNSAKGQKLAANPDWANQLDALQTLGATARPTQSTVVPSLWDVKHAVRPMLEYGIGAGVTGAAGDYATTGHVDPTHVATEALAGLVGGYGLHAGYPAIQGRLQQAAQNRAIAAARVALSTGAQQSPVLPAAPIRDALRSLIYSRGAAGSY